MFVITITDTITGVTATAVTSPFVVKAVFTAAEVALDGVDEDTTGFTPEIIAEADQLATKFSGFASA